MKQGIKKAILWLGSIKALAVFRQYVGVVLLEHFRNKGFALAHANSEALSCFDVVKRIRQETDMLLSDLDAYTIYTVVKKTEKIEGDIAEVGSYKGGSAKLIRQVTTKTIHLFDTFEGLPDLCEHDDLEQFEKGDFSASLESVQSYLKDCSDIYFYKGIFPATAEPIKNKQFSFVHFDVDAYESTLDCIKFFYPRMSHGGVMVSHDYFNSKGVRKAFDEFFNDKLEIIIEPFGTVQCLVVKV